MDRVKQIHKYFLTMLESAKILIKSSMQSTGMNICTYNTYTFISIMHLKKKLHEFQNFISSGVEFRMTEINGEFDTFTYLKKMQL